MTKLLFIAVPNFQDIELFNTKEALGSDFHVEIASSVMSPIRGVGGSEVIPNVLIENAVPSDFDGIVLIGGSGLGDVIYDNPIVLQHLIAQIKSFNQAEKLVSAICISPVVLAKAGIITGKKITCWDDGKGSQKTEIESAGATFTGHQRSHRTSSNEQIETRGTHGRDLYTHQPGDVRHRCLYPHHQPA